MDACLKQNIVLLRLWRRKTKVRIGVVEVRFKSLNKKKGFFCIYCKVTIIVTRK